MDLADFMVMVDGRSLPDVVISNMISPLSIMFSGKRRDWDLRYI